MRLLVLLVYVIGVINGVDFACATEKPREPRVLVFTADWCPHCKFEPGTPADFKTKLGASGWQVGESQRDHVQVINIDQRADLAETYGVVSVPCCVLVDGKEMHKPVPYKDWTSITELVKTTVVKAQATVSIRQHEHVCAHCGNAWWHQDSSSREAHRCSNCGRMQFDQSGRTRTIEIPVVAKQRASATGCVSGYCPLQGR